MASTQVRADVGELTVVLAPRRLHSSIAGVAACDALSDAVLTVYSASARAGLITSTGVIAAVNRVGERVALRTVLDVQ